MGCFRMVVGLLGFGLLLIGVGSVVILVKIGGKSDGPGALLFYIGAAGGLAGAWLCLSSLGTGGGNGGSGQGGA